MFKIKEVETWECVEDFYHGGSYISKGYTVIFVEQKGNMVYVFDGFTRWILEENYFKKHFKKKGEQNA